MAFAVFVHLIACLAAALLPIAVDDSDASSPSQANAERNAGTKCAWDCNIIDPNFELEMKALISEVKIVHCYSAANIRATRRETMLKPDRSQEEFFTCRILDMANLPHSKSRRTKHVTAFF